MDKEQIDKYGKQIHSTVPFLGGMIARNAIRKLADDSSELSVKYLVEGLSSRHSEVKRIASEALRSLREQNLIDALCEQVIIEPSANLVKIAIEKDYYPKDKARRALFFLISNQMERYFDYDFEQQYLKAEYGAGDEKLRQRIARIISNSGDARLASVLHISATQKIAVDKDSSHNEVQIAIDVYSRNEKWQEVFELMFYAPSYVAANTLSKLKESGWGPSDQQAKSLLSELYEIRSNMKDSLSKPPEPEVVIGPVIGEWIKEGRGSDYDKKSESQIRNEMGNVDPAVSIPALSALQNKQQLSDNDINAAKNHTNWLVRIASLALCETSPEMFFAETNLSKEGGELWVDQLTPFVFEQSAYSLQAAKLKLNHLEWLQKSLAQSKKHKAYPIHHISLVEAMLRYKLGGMIIPDETIIDSRIKEATVGFDD